MKKLLSFILCIFTILNLAACSFNSDNSAIKSPQYPVSIPFDDYDKQQSLVYNNPIDKSYINALNNFSYETASKILNGDPDNVVFSPLSLYMALGLVCTGAKGTTQREIISALGLKGKDNDFLSKQNGNLFRLLYLDNKIGKLKIANSLWLNKGSNFKDAFINNSVKNFYSSIHSVRFSDDKTAQLMSKWISDNTNGILSPDIDLDPNQIMSIINTIYLKDEWVDRFNKDATKPDTFYLKDGSEIKCDFMNNTFPSHEYMMGDGFISSSLSLKNAGSMQFILPDRGVSIEDLISTPKKIAYLFDSRKSENGRVIFKIPKFSFGNSFNLKETFKSMGIVSTFEQNANFRGITDDTAYISDILHQSHIAIDEKGVEAAAFTQICYSGSAAPNGKVAEMILDRPFIFAIKSEDGAILFIGVVNNPLSK